MAHLTPLVLMYTLGHGFVPPPIHTGTLRYYGDAPLLCHLVKEGLIETDTYNQIDVFKSAMTFSTSEGIIPT